MQVNVLIQVPWGLAYHACSLMLFSSPIPPFNFGIKQSVFLQISINFIDLFEVRAQLHCK